jgi:DNA-binding GntR family transcriptional regulator
MELSTVQDLSHEAPVSVRGAATVYELIRQDIVEGRLAAGSRLKAGDLALRYGTSTNPVREALQQLRGEGFVLFSHNRGARVRPIDEDFIRDIYEVTALLEPYMTRWFVDYATDEDIARLEAIQAEIEAAGFDDPDAYSVRDQRFHRVVYDRHYNRHAVDMWWRHREILRAIGSHVPFSRARRQAILHEHRELIACVNRHDAEGAGRIMARHVEGSGRHLIEQLRAARASGERARPPA